MQQEGVWGQTQELSLNMLHFHMSGEFSMIRNCEPRVLEPILLWWDDQKVIKEVEVYIWEATDPHIPLSHGTLVQQKTAAYNQRDRLQRRRDIQSENIPNAKRTSRVYTLNEKKMYSLLLVAEPTPSCLCHDYSTYQQVLHILLQWTMQINFTLK